MRRQDKQRPKKRGVWLQLYSDGSIGWLPVRIPRERAIDMLARTLSQLRSVDGMTRQ